MYICQLCRQGNHLLIAVEEFISLKLLHVSVCYSRFPQLIVDVDAFLLLLIILILPWRGVEFIFQTGEKVDFFQTLIINFCKITTKFMLTCKHDGFFFSAGRGGGGRGGSTFFLQSGGRVDLFSPLLTQFLHLIPIFKSCLLGHVAFNFNFKKLKII